MKRVSEWAELAEAAKVIFESLPYDLKEDHGVEVAEGFFVVYNTDTGQSKQVLWHEPTDRIFKWIYSDWSKVKLSYSGLLIGEAFFDGAYYPVRLPEFEYFDYGHRTVEVQEYVRGAACGCDWRDCPHGPEIRRVTGVLDTHQGNWKFNEKGEIVLFDFDGIEV